jgi:hypothetical protein
MQLDVLHGASDTRESDGFAGVGQDKCLDTLGEQVTEWGERRGMVEEEIMGETRRRFLMSLAAASCSVATHGTVFAQVRNTRPFPTPPASAETQNPAEKDGTTPDPQSAKRAALKQNEREFRAGVDRLYRLASELKQEVDKTGTTEVFSVRMYKRMEEIEKVAKLLKGRAKG